jgi:hypothetical protein
MRWRTPPTIQFLQIIEPIRTYARCALYDNATLARGTRWRVPRCIPSGCGAHPALSRTAPVKRAAVSSLVRVLAPDTRQSGRSCPDTQTISWRPKSLRALWIPRPTVRRLDAVRGFRAPEPTTSVPPLEHGQGASLGAGNPNVRCCMIVLFNRTFLLRDVVFERLVQRLNSVNSSFHLTPC